jgi:hypothetical protein
MLALIVGDKFMWESIVKGFERILERPVILVLILGAVLFVLGAASGVQYNGWLPLDAYGRWFVLGVGLLLLLGGAALCVDDANKQIDIAHCKIKVTTPKEEQTVEVPDVEGTIEQLPPRGQELWILQIYPERDFVPLKRVELKSGIKTWLARKCFLGGEPGDSRTIGAYLVGKSGQALLQYYEEATEFHDRTKANPKVYLPKIQVMTEDMVRCDEVDVVKK